MNEKNFSNWIVAIAVALTKLARPYLTVFITTIYNVALLMALYYKDMTVQEYIMAVGPVNGLVMGFWFGERSAQKPSVKNGTEE